ncbi:hypothetical protein LJB98_03275, partial [Bacteroidales bacterium OttesenSCG-928-M11]|nr:hypothetical protein [Bacteroidales bacterium OttesenSCG-928-M11]
MKPIKLILVILFLISFGINAQQIYLDPNFGKEGVAVFGGIDVYSMETDQDGNVFAVGYFLENTDDYRHYGKKVVVLKIDSQGNLDKNFGSDGIVITEVEFELLRPSLITRQPDSKIIVASQCKGNLCNLALLRYLPNGNLDDSFGKNGISIINSNSHWIDGFSLLPLADNSLFINASFGDEDGYSYPAIAKIKENGSLDESFQDKGILYIKSMSGSKLCSKILSLSDGNFLGLLASCKSLIGGADYYYLKFDHKGDLDNTFGNNGILKESCKDETVSTYYTTAFEQQDGKIIIGSPSVSYKRLHSDGVLDESFNADKVSGRDIISQSDGKLLFVGPYLKSTIRVIRVTNNGSIDFDISTPKLVGDYYYFKFINDRSFIASGVDKDKNLVFTKVIIDPDATLIPDINNEESISVTQESENISVRSESPIQLIQ